MEGRGSLGARPLQGGGAGAEEPRGARLHLRLRHPERGGHREAAVPTAQAEVSERTATGEDAALLPSVFSSGFPSFQFLVQMKCQFYALRLK